MKRYMTDMLALLFETVFNSLTIKKQTTKFSSANFQIKLSPCYIIQRLRGQMV